MKTNFALSHRLITPTTSILLFISCATYAQAPGIEWQNTIGGNGGDDLTSLIQTTDNAFIFSGSSSSQISGDKSESTQGGSDFWIVKLDQNGSKLWDRTIGGSERDILPVISATSDDGYILVGRSRSGISGDKTEANFGDYDYWILKLNSSGAIEWQKTAGGTGEEIASTVFQTEDGGYLVGGSSLSGISGNKTITETGAWILKLNASGNIIWQKVYTGINFFGSMIQTNDGGYLFGGGIYDYSVIKTDSFGNIEWQRTYSGSDQDALFSVIQTEDGGYALGGYSYSGISGDKTESCFGVNDYWIIKIDPFGIIEWQNTIGGNHLDEFQSFIQTEDNGFLIGGYTESGISGDKNESSNGHTDYWILKLDSYGNLLWQSAIGGSGSDILTDIIQSPDGGYFLGGYSNSPISGDKTESAINKFDCWVVKLFPDNGTCFPPADFSTSVIPDKVKINWAPDESIIGNKIRYRIAGSESWIIKTIQDKNFVILNDLACNADYEWQILSMCSGDTITYSDYSPLHFFTTAACRLGGEEKKGELTVYPNPASDQVNISFTGETGDAIMHIFNMNGEIVFENYFGINDTYRLLWNSENVSSGIYQLRITINGNYYEDKILINK